MLVSVVIPVYNREASIQKAMQSVLKQTYSNLELIVVDDGSSDNTVGKASEVLDDRVIIISSPENKGACAARNTGIDAARGELIAFQDSDDEWHEDMLLKLIDKLEETRSDMVFSARQVIKRLNGKIIKEAIPYYNLNEYENKLARVLISNCASTQTMLVQRRVFQNIRFDERLPRFQDWDLMIQILKASFSVKYLNEVLVDCYTNEDSITSNSQKAKTAFQILEDKYKEEWGLFPESYAEFCAKAAFYLESHGLSGRDYFRKEFVSRKTPYAFGKYILSVLGMYKHLNPEIRKACIK